MVVTTASSVLKFTLKELEVLVKDADSQVYLKKDVKYPLKLTPACLQNVNQAITEILNAERLKYLPAYEGLLLSFKHVRRHSNMGTINDDECNILIHIHVDLYIFAPKIGCTMTGIVSKISEDNIGCLVHKGFNVTLPRPRKKGDTVWLGNSVRLGDEVKFKLDSFNVVGTLPYIRGILLSHKKNEQKSALSQFLLDDDEDDLLPPKNAPKSEKRKKHPSETEESETKLKNDAVKRPRKKKKKHSQNVEDQSDLEDAIPDLLAARKERRKKKKQAKEFDAFKSDLEIGNVAVVQKRKGDPIADTSSKLIPQDLLEPLQKSSSKNILKLSESKSKILPALAEMSATGIADELEMSSLKNTEKKKKKSKPANVDQAEPADDNGDYSVETLIQNAIKNIGAETKKSKLKLSQSLPAQQVGDSGSNEKGDEGAKSVKKKTKALAVSPTKSLLQAIDDNSFGIKKVDVKKDNANHPSPKKNKKTAAVTEAKIDSLAQETVSGMQKKTSGSPKKSLAQCIAEIDGDSLPTENGKGIKKNKSSKNLTIAPNTVEFDASSSGKKKKLKLTKKEDIATDNIEDMSIEALKQKALENVSGKTPKPKKSRASAPFSDKTKTIHSSEGEMAKLPHQELLQSAKKKSKSKLSFALDNPTEVTSLKTSNLVNDDKDLHKLASLEVMPNVKSSKKAKIPKLSALVDDDDLGNASPSKQTPKAIRKAFIQSPINIGDISSTKKSKSSKSMSLQASTSAVMTPLPSSPPLPSINLLSAQKKDKTKKKPRELALEKSDIFNELLNLEKSVQFDLDQSSSSRSSKKKKKGEVKSRD